MLCSNMHSCLPVPCLAIHVNSELRRKQSSEIDMYSSEH